MACNNCANCKCNTKKEFKLAGTITDETSVIPEACGGAKTVGELRALLAVGLEKQLAIKQHLSKPAPIPHACGCMGQKPFPGYEDKPWNERKLEPLCYCAMAWVEVVNDRYYQVTDERTPEGVKFEAKYLGPVGGPYVVDCYGRDL